MTASEAGPLLAGWGERFSCYTAALATWSAHSRERWWRPLLAGGPVLAVTPQPRGGWRFDHSPRPWSSMLGLRLRSASSWPEARDGLDADLADGPVILAGDVFALPWQRGHRGWHAPHWVTVRGEGGVLVADDPLILMTAAGIQHPYRGTFALDELSGIGPAMPAGDEVLWLRERSVLGSQDPARGAAYRWLAPGLGPGADGPVEAAGRLVGPDALRALADDLADRGAESAVLRQVDDLWQALRLRELAAAAAELDPELFDAAAAGRRAEALEAWRDLPVVLHHARIRAASGSPRAGAGAAGALRELAALEARPTGAVV